MKNIFEVLKQKEDQVDELKLQVYALKAVIPLLAEGVHVELRDEPNPKPQVQPLKEFP